MGGAEHWNKCRNTDNKIIGGDSNVVNDINKRLECVNFYDDEYEDNLELFRILSGYLQCKIQLLKSDYKRFMSESIDTTFIMSSYCLD